MSRREWLIAGALIVLLGLFLYALWMPAVQMVRSGPQPSCRNQFKVIALALHNYHDEYGSFPPAYVADADGKPLHSWRVRSCPGWSGMTCTAAMTSTSRGTAPTIGC